MSSSSTDSLLRFLRPPHSNPNMEEETYTRERLDACIERLEVRLLSRISEPVIINQLKDMLSFLEVYMDETNEYYFEFHTEEDYPFPYEWFNSDIFGVNPKRMLDQAYDEEYPKFGEKIKEIIYGELNSYFYRNDNNNNINENPQGMGGGRSELDEAIKSTKAWLYYICKNRRNKKIKNKKKTEKPKKIRNIRRSKNIRKSKNVRKSKNIRKSKKRNTI